VSTVVTVPAALLAFLFAAFSSMGCDACDAMAAHRFDRSFDTGFTAFRLGLLVPLLLLTAGWTLPRREYGAGLRMASCVLAPLCVILDFVMFCALITWP
jgi:hypothetical protein